MAGQVKEGAQVDSIRPVGGQWGRGRREVRVASWETGQEPALEPTQNGHCCGGSCGQLCEWGRSGMLCSGLGRLQSGTSGARGGTPTHSRLTPSGPEGGRSYSWEALSKATRTGCAPDKACAARVPTQRPRCAGTPVARTLTSTGVSVYRQQEVAYVGPFPPTGTQQQVPWTLPFQRRPQVLE